MPRPFLKKTKWQPRKVEAPRRAAREAEPSRVEATPSDTAGQAAASALPAAFRIIPAEHHSAVRRAYREAEQAVDDQLADVREELRRILHVSTARLPQTQQAVAVLRGTHRSFGSEYPAVPPEHQLTSGQNDEIDFEVFERAYNTLIHTDRSAFGFDVIQIVDPKFGGVVDPYGPINSPAEAAGEIEPPTLGEQLTIDEALEERLTMKKGDIFKMIGLAAICFILNTVADALEKCGKIIDDALSFKILGIKVGIGGWIRKGFDALARLLRRWADDLWEKAMGIVPKPGVEEPDADSGTQNLPETSTGSANSDAGDVEDTSGELDVSGLNTPTQQSLDPTQARGGSGMIFLMSAQQALQAVENEARRSGRSDLRDALRRYEDARTGKDLLGTYGQLATTWGVPLKGAIESTDEAPDLGPSTPGSRAAGAAQPDTPADRDQPGRRQGVAISGQSGEALDC